MFPIEIKAALVQITARRLSESSEPMMAWFGDTYMRHLASVS